MWTHETLLEKKSWQILFFLQIKRCFFFHSFNFVTNRIKKHLIVWGCHLRSVDCDASKQGDDCRWGMPPKTLHQLGGEEITKEFFMLRLCWTEKKSQMHLFRVARDDFWISEKDEHLGEKSVSRIFPLSLPPARHHSQSHCELVENLSNCPDSLSPFYLRRWKPSPNTIPEHEEVSGLDHEMLILNLESRFSLALSLLPWHSPNSSCILCEPAQFEQESVNIFPQCKKGYTIQRRKVRQGFDLNLAGTTVFGEGR